MEKKTPIYDPIEEILLSQGPDHGICLEKRVTAIDIIAEAYGDNLVRPTEDKNLTPLESIFFETSAQFDLRHQVPTFYRDGTFEFLGRMHEVSLMVMASDEKRSSLEQIDEDIAGRNYTFSLDLRYPEDEDCIAFREHVCGCVLSVTLEKSFDGTEEKNLLRELSAPKPCEDSYAGCKLLSKKMQKLAEKYKSGTYIDPVEFAKDFLEALGR